MTKNTVMPSAADFDAWTADDEEKALEASAEQMKVKHLIKDGSVWFLAPHGHIYKLPLNLSIDDFVRLSDLQSNTEQIQALKDILAAFAGEKAAKELAKEPVMVPMNILSAYGEIIAKVQGADLGKSSASASSYTERMAI
ncbi:hypothetical protein [Bifidobacterium breve]|uniref:Uncharacterized protein n=1 Tax=Bifidobacterium breve TaxID=1685 RepID=A0A2K9BLZ2_BIFBR|nr:hypothetical protein [Bifidobacterium breve]AUE03550.1 hypothetical protein BB215W447A_1542 [Bifidobacterium breve]AUE05590.1 hypothetical protein CNCMI4321_1379 [Bifidobacterium breve]AUE21013.1 hypothetical protein DRBB30_1377 [Bifidobacterium breve]